MIRKHHFVTYGDDKYHDNKKRIARQAKDFGFDTISVYGSSDLDVDFKERFSDILNYERGGGFWIWKVNILMKKMSEIKEGDYLIYLDAGSTLNKKGKERYLEYIKILEDSDLGILSFQMKHQEREWTTKQIFQYFGVSLESEIAKSGQIMGGLMILKKNEHSNTILNKFYNTISNNSKLITDFYNQIDQETYFKDNRHDQSLLSIIRKNHKSIIVSADETYELPFGCSESLKFPFWATQLKEKIILTINCNWSLNLDLPTIKPCELFLDICQIPKPDKYYLRYNIFYLCEPRSISPERIPWIIKNWNKFDLVLTHDDEILEKCPNSKYCHFTKTFLTENEISTFSQDDKTFLVTFICGGKLMCQGHYTRRNCWDNQEKITIPKKMYYSTQYLGNLKIFTDNTPLERNSKKQAFEKAMFQITMENCRVNGYFTEKIIDCFASYTIPIYYGCPNISEYFHVEGIIIANSVEEIINIVNNLTEEDYNNRKEWMEKNREIVMEKFRPDLKDSFMTTVGTHLKELLL